MDSRKVPAVDPSPAPQAQPLANEGRRHTFLFADLAGYTALTEVHGDLEAAELAAEFFDGLRHLLPEYGAEEVKTIGDCMMIRTDHPDEAVRLGLQVVKEVGARHGFPGVRLGMHSGPAVERDGDFFGATVNVAARVAALAANGEVLLTEATREGIGELPEIELRRHGRHDLKNVAEPVELFAAAPAGSSAAAGLPIDPVCRMAIDPQQTAGDLIHEGTTYHFCSLQRAGAFAAAPERYTARA